MGIVDSEQFSLRQDLERRAIADQVPDFFDLLISDCDAAVGPIASAMGSANESVSIRQAMNEDIFTWRDAQFVRPFAIGRIGIRNMQRAMKLAVRFPAIDNVDAFGRFVVTLSCLRSDRIPAERDFVSLDYLAGAHQVHRARVFVNDDVVCVRKVRCKKRQVGKQQRQQNI